MTFLWPEKFKTTRRRWRSRFKTKEPLYLLRKTSIINFEYQHKYKYRTKLDGGNGDGGEESDVRIDRIEYYKKEQLKVEESKKKMDDILMNLINKNAISENLDNFDMNKIDIKDINELANYYRECYGEDPL